MLKAPIAFLVSAAAVFCASLATPALAANPAEFQARTLTYGSNTLNYQVYIPPTYNPSKQYPLVLVMHGAGEVGSNNTSQINGNIDNLFNHIKMPQYESILIAPQVPSGGWWGGWEGDMAIRIKHQIESEYNINMNKEFATGLSMGGYGTWDMADRYTNEFDAFVPICGVQGNLAAAPKFKDKPIWAFHAADDGTVGVSATRNMVTALRNAGGNPIYTEYTSGGHGIWGRAYATEELYTWLYGTPAGPELVYTKTDLGNGKFGYTFKIHNEDGKLKSYAVTLGFTGAIKQTLASNILTINDEDMANQFNGQNYNKADDTWVFAPFKNILPGVNPLDGTSVNGFVEGTNSYVISCGTVAGSQYGDNTNVLYLVADGNVNWTGTISRDGVIYDVSGVTPEPATITMLLIGGLAAIRKGRRAA